MNLLTGASACLRKAIYEFLKREGAEGYDYDEKIKSLKSKFPYVNEQYFIVLSHIKDMTSNKVHELSWEKWRQCKTYIMDYINGHLDKKWKLLTPGDAAFHMNGDGGEFNIKFISPDEHFEAIYNSRTGSLVTDPENMGTYNYVGPMTDWLGHTTYDVNPFFQWANTDGQGLNRTVVGGGAEETAKSQYNLARYDVQEEAQANYAYYLNATHQ